MREAIFEILGEGFRGRVPVAMNAVCEVDGLWMASGFVDDGAVLELADGSWFGTQRPDSLPNRRMVAVVLSKEHAEELDAALAEGRKLMWALDPLHVLDCGDEASFGQFMDDPGGTGSTDDPENAS